MSGTDKFTPPFGRFHSDLRYYNGGGPPGLQPSSSPSVSASVPPPAPHPFIAHFYPIAPGIEPLNPGYQLPNNPISQPSSAAALVALAASGCVGQNLSSQLLRNFQNKAQKLALQSDSKTNFSSDSNSPPSKKQRQQFDVDSLTDNSSPSNLPSASFNNNFVSYPQASITAWHQLLRRFRGSDSSQECHSFESPAELLRNYYGSSASVARLGNAEGASGFTAPRNEPHFSAKNHYGSSMIAAANERMALESQATKRSSIGKSPPYRQHPALLNRPNPVEDGPATADGNFTSKDQSSPRGYGESRDAIVDVDSPFTPTSSRCFSASPVQLDDLQRTRRRKRSSPMVETCPVCGVTVRPSEVASHIQQELESLGRIPSETKRKNATYRRSSTERRSSVFRGQGSSATSATSSSKRLSDRDLSPKTNRSNRLKTYHKVRGNRMDRLNARVGHCMQPTSLAMLGATGRLWAASSSSTASHMEDTCCPVCSSRLSGSIANMNDHVEACLRRQRATSRQLDEDELVDVEGNNDNPTTHNFVGLGGTGCNDDDRSNKSFGSEYEWCGQSRVRVTGFAESASRLAVSSGYHVVRPSSPGADQFLNVESDDTQCFGPVQFTEEDLNACRSPQDPNERGRTPKSSTKPGTSFTPTCSPGVESRDETDDCPPSPNQHTTEQSLRCNICMDTYTDPVASIQCWHVHCERCWLRALAVKKLCPQCNAITTATKLRRIFL